LIRYRPEKAERQLFVAGDAYCYGRPTAILERSIRIRAGRKSGILGGARLRAANRARREGCPLIATTPEEGLEIVRRQGRADAVALQKFAAPLGEIGALTLGLDALGAHFFAQAMDDAEYCGGDRARLHVAGVHGKRLREQGEQLFGNAPGVCSARDSRQKKHEFVAAEVGDRILLAQVAAQSVRRFFQNDIADLVAGAVVHAHELIEVHV
jgi:hypothetical protein